MAKREVIIEVQLDNKDAIRQLGRLEIETKKYQRDLRELNKEIQLNGGATREQAERVGELNARIRANQGSIREMKNDLSGLTAAGMRFRDKMAEASRAGLGAFGLNVLSVTGAVAGLASIIKSSVGIIADFDKAQSNLAAIMGTNKEGIADLTEEAKKYGATTAFTASQVSQLQTELAKLGFTQQQIKAATPAVLDLAAATGTDLANAATIAAQTLNAFQLSAEETQRVVDVIAKSANLSAFDIDTFSAAMSNAAPAAKAAGIELEEVTAMLSVLVDAGIPAEKAGTDVRNILISLAKEGKTSAEAFAELRGSTDKLSAAVGMFDQRAAGSAIILADNTKKVEELNEAYKNVTGTAAEMSRTQLDNLKGDQLLLQSAWEGFILSVEQGTGVWGRAMRSITKTLTELLGMLTPDAGDKFADGVEAQFAQMDNALTKHISLRSDAAQEEIRYATQRIEALNAIADEERRLANAQARRDKVVQQIQALEAKGQSLTSKGVLQLAVLRQELVEIDKVMKVEVDTRKQSAVVLDAETEATEKNTEAKKEQAKAIRVITDELRAFLKAQKDIEQGIGVGRMRVVGGIGSQTDIGTPESRMLPGTQIAENLSDNLEQTQELTDQYGAMFMTLATSIGEALGSAYEDVEEANKRVLLSILETVRSAIRLYLAGTLGREVFTKGFAGIATFAAITTLVEATLAAAMAGVKGFAVGGYTAKSGSDSAPVGVVHANEWVAPADMVRDPKYSGVIEALERARKGMGFAYNPAQFATGGFVPRPSPTDLQTAGMAGEARAMGAAPIFVRVTDINAMLGRVAAITERATI